MILFIMKGEVIVSAFKKFLCAVIVFAISINLFGCGLIYIEDKDEEIGNKMEGKLEQLFLAVQNGDRETFKNFFDEDVALQADFQYGIDYVFELYQGDLKEVKWTHQLGTGEHIGPEKHYEYAFGSFDIVTSENEYLLYMEFYTQYKSKYPKGTYIIRKFKLLEKDSLERGENFHDCSQRYGIYYPGWLGG